MPAFVLTTNITLSRRAGGDSGAETQTPQADPRFRRNGRRGQP